MITKATGNSRTGIPGGLGDHLELLMLIVHSQASSQDFTLGTNRGRDAEGAEWSGKWGGGIPFTSRLAGPGFFP